jgi:hypothetical protein
MAVNSTDLAFRIRREIDGLFDSISWLADVEDNETVFNILNNEGYSDLADAWYNYCSDGGEGWPNQKEVEDDTTS